MKNIRYALLFLASLLLFACTRQLGSEDIEVSTKGRRTGIYNRLVVIDSLVMGGQVIYALGDTIIDPDKTTAVISDGFQGDGTIYVNPLGNDTTGVQGSFFQPFRTPQGGAQAWDGLSDVEVKIAEGEYNYTGPYPVTTGLSLGQTSDNVITYTGEADFIISNTGTSRQSFITDGVEDGFPTTTPEPFHVIMDMPNSTMTATNIGSSTGQVHWFVFQDHENSTLRMRLRKVEYADDLVRRFISFSLNGQESDIDIDTSIMHGQTLVTVGDPGNEFGSVDTTLNRRHNIHFGYVQADYMQTSNAYGYFRVSPTARNNFGLDSASVYRFDVDEFVSASTSSDYTSLAIIYPVFEGGSTGRKDIDNEYHFRFGDVDLGDNINRSVFAVSPIDTMYNSTLTWHVDKLENGTTNLWGYRSASDDCEIVNSSLKLTGGEMNFNTGGTINFEGMYMDGCTFIIDIDDLNAVDEAINFALDNGIENSTFIISGNLSTSAAGTAVINLDNIATSNTIILKNLTVENDGTVASIQSSVARTVFVQNVADVNTIVADPDITFTAYDAY